MTSETGWQNVTVRLTPSEVASLDDIARKRADKTRANVSRQALLRGFVLDGIRDAGRPR